MGTNTDLIGRDFPLLLSTWYHSLLLVIEPIVWLLIELSIPFHCPEGNNPTEIPLCPVLRSCRQQDLNEGIDYCRRWEEYDREERYRTHSIIQLKSSMNTGLIGNGRIDWSDETKRRESIRGWWSTTTRRLKILYIHLSLSSLFPYRLSHTHPLCYHTRRDSTLEVRSHLERTIGYCDIDYRIPYRRIWIRRLQSRRDCSVDCMWDQGR